MSDTAMSDSGGGTVAGQTAVRERHSLTLDQRRALRRWANSQTVRPSHKACIEWFQAQYNQTISQSTVSHSLSPKYARLDGDPQLSGSRLRFGNWPDVERLVLLWHQGMVNSGRNPSNEELAEKAKAIFSQLPRYKDEQAPEFSPGWIHRFKKRYGLLIRRQRRHGTAPNPAEDVPYLADSVSRYITVSSETSPAAIHDTIQRIVGVDSPLGICALVRDEMIRRLENQNPLANGHPGPAGAPPHPGNNTNNNNNAVGHPDGNPVPAAMYAEEDPDIVLQNALRALQEDEAVAEAQAAVVREERDRVERGLPPLGTIAGQAYAQTTAVGGPMVTTPGSGGARASVGANGGGGGARFAPPTPGGQTGTAGPSGEDLTLTPIPSGGPLSMTERPVRCPFCVNQRMLRTIKEAVEHLSTHIVV